MPSAASNNTSTNHNKLEKQSSVSSVLGVGGAGPGGRVEDSAQNAVDTTTTAAATNAESTASTNNDSEINAAATKEKGAAVAANATVAGGSSITGGGSVVSNDAVSPMKQVLITIEHKIRNLEKRKTKLESYRTIQAEGKELSNDQKAAVAKYDAVMASLDFARELSKQMLQFSKEAEKDQRKQARKELIQKAQVETAKIREVLIIQNIMSCFVDETIRADFLNGDNGAVKVEESDMNAVQKFCTDIQTRRPESADDAPFIGAAQKAAELFSMTIDGRPKQFGDTTFENLRRVFNQIQECGYLDKIYMAVPEPVVEINDEKLTIEDDVNAVEGDETNTSAGEDNSLEEYGVVMENINFSDSAEMVTQQPMQQQQQQVPLMMAAETGGNNGLPPAQLQQQLSLELQQQQQHQQQQLLKEQLELQQREQQQQVSAAVPQAAQLGVALGMSGQQQPPPAQTPQPQNIQAPPASAVPAFQPQLPLPAGAPSGANTPVHVAMFPTQQLQPAPQLQQLPSAGLMNVQQQPPPPTQLLAATGHQPPQQRQLINNPAGGQLPSQAGAAPPMPLHGAPPPPGHFPQATTVHAVEQSFFKQHQYIQQMRPLAEVIGGGSFYFLQESELDSPELGAAAAANAVNATPVYEQQAQHQQAPPNLLNHIDVAVDQQQQQLLANNMSQQQQQQQPQSASPQQPIATQTFTNQSFPPIPNAVAVQQPPSAVAVMAAVANSNNQPTLNSSSPMFQQQQQPPKQQQHLFSPVALQQQQQQQQQLLQQHQAPPQQLLQQQDVNSIAPQPALLLNDQAQQPPMMIMARLAAPQARLPLQQQQLPPQQQPPQQQPTLVGMQPVNPGDVPVVISQANNAGFPFENPVVTTLSSYEQQMMQQQLATSAALNANVNVSTVVVEQKSTSETVNQWEKTLKATNVTATAALTHVLKPSGSDGSATPVMEPTNKWSTEMNTPPPTIASSGGNGAAGNSSSNNTQTRKNEWTSSGGSAGSSSGGGGYGEPATPSNDTTNNWNNSNQQQDVGGGYGRGSGPGRYTYQRRGTDDRRDRDDRRDTRGGGNGGYRGRGGNSYGNSAQQNGGGGRGNSGGGIYFRNNDNSGSSSGGYYQNGGGSAYNNKEAGSRYDSGNYRGPRGGSSNANTGRGNAPQPRSLGARNGAGVGGATNSSAASYINPRQTNRIPMGLENKN